MEREGNKKHFETVRTYTSECKYIVHVEMKPVTKSKKYKFDMQCLFSTITYLAITLIYFQLLSVNNYNSKNPFHNFIEALA